MTPEEAQQLTREEKELIANLGFHNPKVISVTVEPDSVSRAIIAEDIEGNIYHAVQLDGETLDEIEWERILLPLSEYVKMRGQSLPLRIAAMDKARFDALQRRLTMEAGGASFSQAQVVRYLLDFYEAKQYQAIL